MKIKLLFLVLISFAIFSEVSAQKANKKITITGKVTDLNNNPVSGAVIMIDGKNTERKTNNEGLFKIKVKTSALKIGIFTTITGVKEEPVNGRTTINFNLDKSLSQQLNVTSDAPGREAVDAGYSFVKKKDMTKPVNNSDVSGKEYSSYSSIYDILRTLPGVTVTGNNVTVRGVQSMGNTQPLYVVNGTTVRSISGIDPAMVKSVQVLKGPSASVYGIDGANGVILIKLK